MKGVRQWRLDTSVTARTDIVLLPGTAQVVIGHIEYREFRTLTLEDITFGGVYPVTKLSNKGIEVKHTLNKIDVHHEGEKVVGRLNLVLQNRTDSPKIIKKGT